MRSLLVLILTMVLSFVAGLFFPWWSLAVVAFVVALVIKQRPLISFFTSFLAIFLLWFGYSYFIDLGNDHILGNRMSLLFLGKEASILMCVISGGIGGIVAGFAALTAAFLRKSKKDNFKRDKPYNVVPR